MFSNSVKYALKAVLYLSLHTDEKKKILAKDLAKPINVPPAYIAKLLQVLVKNDIISSNKGPRGGFYLTKQNKESSIINIINCIDDKQKMDNCLLSLKECNKEKPCPLHQIAYPLRSKLIQTLKSKSVNDLSEVIDKGEAFLPL